MIALVNREVARWIEPNPNSKPAKGDCQARRFTVGNATHGYSVFSWWQSALRNLRHSARWRESANLLSSGNSAVVGRPRAGGGPQELSIVRRDADVIDTRFTAAHQAVVVEFPKLVAV